MGCFLHCWWICFYLKRGFSPSYKTKYIFFGMNFYLERGMEVGIERCSAEGRRKNLFDLILSVRNNSFSSKIFSSFHHLWELDGVFDNWIYFIDNQLVQEMLLQTTIWKRVGVECLVLISNYAKYLFQWTLA